MKQKIRRIYSAWGKTVVYLILFGLFLGFALRERKDVFNAQQVLRHAQPEYLILGLAAAVATILMHGLLYQTSLALLGRKVPYKVIARLFLKRFFLSTFIPAGFAASQYALSSELEEHGVQSMEGHVASTLYIVVGGLSFVTMLIPTLILLALDGQASQFIWGASLFATALTVFWIWQLQKIFKQRGLLYAFLIKRIPELEAVIKGHEGKRLVRDLLIRMLPYSLVLDALGAVTLMFSGLCVGVHLSPAQALMGYIVNILILTVSPLFQGVGFVEISLVYLLRQFGIEFSSAITVAIVYRFFQMWVPFFSGMYLMFRTHLLRAWRHLPAIFTGILGIVNIISYFRPSTSFLGRIGDFQDSLSPDYFTVTRGAALIIGVILIVLSYYLYYEYRLAWQASLFLVLFSMASHSVGGVDVPEMVVSILVGASLLAHRQEYRAGLTLGTL